MGDRKAPGLAASASAVRAAVLPQAKKPAKAARRHYVVGGALNEEGATPLRFFNLDESPGAPPVSDQLQVALRANATKVLTLFSSWDTNNDGGVSRKEFHKAMTHLGLDVKAVIIDELFTSWQDGGSGNAADDDTLEARELAKILKRPPLMQSLRKEVRAALASQGYAVHMGLGPVFEQHFDSDADGQISLDEFQACLRKLRIPLSPLQGKQIFATIDTDGHGTISVEALDSAICPKAKKVEVIVIDPPPEVIDVRALRFSERRRHGLLPTETDHHMPTTPVSVSISGVVVRGEEWPNDAPPEDGAADGSSTAADGSCITRVDGTPGVRFEDATATPKAQPTALPPPAGRFSNTGRVVGTPSQLKRTQSLATNEGIGGAIRDEKALANMQMFLRETLKRRAENAWADLRQRQAALRAFSAFDEQLREVQLRRPRELSAIERLAVPKQQPTPARRHHRVVHRPATAGHTPTKPIEPHVHAMSPSAAARTEPQRRRPRPNQPFESRIEVMGLPLQLQLDGSRQALTSSGSAPQLRRRVAVRPRSALAASVSTVATRYAEMPIDVRVQPWGPPSAPWAGRPGSALHARRERDIEARYAVSW